MLIGYQSSPAPALLARRAGVEVEWEPNDACATWPQAASWSRAQWRELAHAVLAADGPGRADGNLPSLGLRWHSVAEDGGRLAWLRAERAEQAAAPASDDATASGLAECLRVAEQRARLAAECAGFGVFTIDVLTGERHWDEQMRRLRGLAPDDPRSVDELRAATMAPDSILRLDDDIEQTLQRARRGELPAGWTSERVEFAITRPDGEVRWLASRGMLVDEPGRHLLLTSLHWDVTAQRLARELREERAAAEVANRAKGRFLANMSHEIRTPMNAVLGMSHLALQSGLNARQHNYVSKVQRSAQSLLRLINDILDFANIEAGRLDVQRVDFKLGDVMDGLAQLIGPQADEKGLELLFVESPELPMALVGDVQRLSQVLFNLGTNAIKFTERGEVIVRIDALERDDDSVLLRLSVRDTGIGIAPDLLKQLFQPFSRAEATTSQRHDGPGLGLAISQGLVGLLGGHLEVDSKPGAGSEFAFQARFGLQRGAARPLADLRAAVANARVLVVDDNPTAREILCEMAWAIGLQAEEARDGWEALRSVSRARAAGRPFDVVLLDWVMPGMDGIQCAQQLMASAQHDQPMVMMTTAFGRDEVVQRLDTIRLQVSDVLVKPVTPSTLLDAVALALKKRSGPDTATERTRRLATHRERLRGARLLLVEDNAINQELAFELLTEAGILVTVVENGRQALDMLDGPAFDGVLMDCQMPVMDGYEATRAIRAQARWRQLPVIALTADAMVGDRENALAAGMNDHIAKPIAVSEMFETIARWVVPVSAAAIAPPPAPPVTPMNALPDTLPGIDRKIGEATTMGNLKLYRRLLVLFRDGNADFDRQFRSARASNDTAGPMRLAHTLGSSAGTLGAVGVQRAAMALEHACDRSADDQRIEALLQGLAHELAPVIAGLRALI